MRNPDEYTWRGRTANVLAIGAAGSLGAMSLGLAWAAISGHAVPESAVTVVSTGIGALVGAVATYLGGSRREDKQTTEPARPATGRHRE